MAMCPHLTATQLSLELAARPGLIPVQLDANAGQAVWVDMNGYHCYEGSFHHSLVAYAGMSQSKPQRFTSPLDFLASTGVPEGCIPPTGFIFHVGRCGSTLLAKALARSRAHLVFGEAAPHSQIWRVLSGADQQRIEMYRTLLLTMGRPRLSSYRAHIVKFTSFNIINFQFIRAAFPGVPALFLFRNPGQVMDSYRRGSPRWMGKDPGIGRTWRTAETAIEDFFETALSIRDADFQYLDYARLKPALLPAILRFFHLDPSMEERRLMASEFAWGAKNGNSPRRFEPVSRDAATAPVRLRELYDCLAARPQLD